MKDKRTAAIVLIVAACLVHIVAFRSKVEMDIPIVYRLLSALLALVITLPLHEGIHWVFMRLFGLRDARIEKGIDPLGLPSFRTTASGQLTGGKRVVTLLAPFVLLTLIPDIVFCCVDRIALFFFIVAMCNAAGCCFDLMDAVR